MARVRAPARRLRAPGHPSPLPLRRCACSGQGRYAAAHRPPALGLPPGGPAPLFAPPLPPARPRSGASPAACGGTAAPCRFPPRLAGSACRRLPRPAPPPPPPAPLRRAAGRAAARPGAVPRPSPWSLRSPLPAAGGPPARPPLSAGSLRSPGRCRAVGPPGSAPPAACPPSSLGRLAAWSGFGLRGSRPGLRRGCAPLSPALRPGRGGAAGAAWGLGCSAPAGAGVPPPAGGGRGDHLASWLSWRLRVVWPWLSRGLGRGPFRAVSKGIRAPPSRAMENPVDSTYGRGGGGFQGEKQAVFAGNFPKRCAFCRLPPPGWSWYIDSTNCGSGAVDMVHYLGNRVVIGTHIVPLCRWSRYLQRHVLLCGRRSCPRAAGPCTYIRGVATVPRPGRPRCPNGQDWSSRCRE